MVSATSSVSEVTETHLSLTGRWIFLARHHPTQRYFAGRLSQSYLLIGRVMSTQVHKDISTRLVVDGDFL